MQCECPSKKALIQFNTSSGICSCAIFLSISVACRTVSNAFEKSSAMILTNGFVDNIVSMVWKRAISAAVVEPVGLKKNWSAK